MAENSYIKEGGLDKTWKTVEVRMIDSVISKKKTICVNDKELLSKEVW